MKIYVLTTGGTIEKIYSEQEGQVVNVANKIGRYLNLLRLPDTDIQVVPVMNKDSLEMTAGDRADLAVRIAALLPERCPMVITHGTDTMTETGRYIQREFPQLAVPIILTGAMRPLGFEGSDGLQNLTESLLAARLLAPGVYIVFHGQVFPADRAVKDRELGTFVRLA
ncbi:MAG TPA: asparaginase [Acidobacteriaceae bacterium]|jgi:L-asparaginase|nr:asparaginase [Acidobacteriaceae bacterium]